MVIIPLAASSIVLGIAGTGGGEMLRSVGIRLAVFVGIAVVNADRRELTRPIVALAEAVLEVSMTVIRTAMRFAPLAVFGLIADTVASNGLRTLVDLAIHDDEDGHDIIVEVIATQLPSAEVIAGVVPDPNRPRLYAFSPDRFEPDAQTLALYHFDEREGDVLRDSSGNGHHGTIHGGTAPDLVPGREGTGGAIALDGEREYVAITMAHDLPISARGRYTIGAWVKADPGPNQVLYCEASTEGLSPVFRLAFDPTGETGQTETGDDKASFGSLSSGGLY